MPKKKVSRKTPQVEPTIRPGSTRVNVVRDPRALKSDPQSKGGKLRAAAFDLATNTGLAHALFSPGKLVTLESLSPVFLGQLDLSAASYESGAIRFVRLYQALEELQPDIIFYEQVRFSPTAKPGGATIGQIMGRVYSTAELIGAFKSVLLCYAEQRDIPCCGLGIGEIKRRATEHGNANKVDMINACNVYFGTDFETANYETSGVDNIADAAWILVRGLELYSKGAELLEHAADSPGADDGFLASTNEPGQSASGESGGDDSNGDGGDDSL